jgi:hypothetical protein
LTNKKNGNRERSPVKSVFIENEEYGYELRSSNSSLQPITQESIIST